MIRRATLLTRVAASAISKSGDLVFLGCAATIRMGACTHRSLRFRGLFQDYLGFADSRAEENAQANAQKSRGNDPAQHGLYII